MNLRQTLIVLFAVLIVGLMLPLSHGIRTALFLMLVALGVLTFLGGGMQYFLSLFH